MLFGVYLHFVEIFEVDRFLYSLKILFLFALGMRPIDLNEIFQIFKEFQKIQYEILDWTDPEPCMNLSVTILWILYSAGNFFRR